MAKRKPKLIDAARHAALSGDVDAALSLLAECVVAGDDSAAASRAELLAFLGRWEEVIPNAARLIANPFAVYAANVFDDMVRLLGRAGRQTGAWGRIGEVAVEARRQVEGRLRTNDMNYPPQKVQAISARLGAILDRLADYAAGGGRPHELVRIFSPAFTPDEAGYRAAVEENEGQSADRLLSLAIAFAVDAEKYRSTRPCQLPRRWSGPGTGTWRGR
jgi:hypothetical protein